MADKKPTNNYYQLRGVNVKASKYEFPTAEFLDIKNMDFDVPNALQKRPGQTQAVTAGTSGPITSLFEFSKLTGESYVVAASDTALFYLTAGAYTLLSAGWNNGQPPDMLTFVNKLWVANGQNWSWWSGNSFLPAGLPPPATRLRPFDTSSDAASFFFVGGATCFPQRNVSGLSIIVRAVFLAYSYVRSDGYIGPADFLRTAQNIVRYIPGTSGEEFFDPSAPNKAIGFTVPPTPGVSSIALWVAVDTINRQTSSQQYVVTSSGGVTTTALKYVGSLGYEDNNGLFGTQVSATLLPQADISRFRLYTIMPSASLFFIGPGVSAWCATFTIGVSGFATYDSVAPANLGYSAPQFSFFTSYIPKYIEINNNIMFSAGFSNSPSSVFYSEVGEPENVLPESSFEVRTNDGDRVFGMKAFNDQLIIMKERSFHKLVGDNADNFQLVLLSTDYGCLSNKTIITYKQKILWLDRKGILEYNGASFDIISTTIEPVFRRMNITAAMENACAVHHLYRNQIWFGIPVDGSSVNNLTVVYDYLVGAWTFFDGFDASAFAFIKGALTKPTVWRGDYSGVVHFFGESFFSDSGVGITCVAFPRFENVGGENQTTLWRRLFLDVAPASGITGIIRGQVFANYNTTTVQATFTMYQSAMQYQNRVEMGVLGKAVSVQFSHNSASLPFLLNGYGWANRGIRNV